MTVREHYLLDDQPAPVSHYCHGVKVAGHLWISGTVGLTAKGEMPEDVVSQFKICMDNIDGVLRAAGGRPEHIVKVQVFLTDINDRAKINPIREAYFGDHRPASTLVEVSALIKPGLKVEIEAEAVIPQES